MAENKKSFILYVDLIHEVEKLSNSDCGNLFSCILNYVNGNEYNLKNKKLLPLFNDIISKIEAGWKTYNPKTDKYHWNYKGGVTPENKAIRNSSELAFWRIRVFERDQYTCQNCGQVGGELNAHHIKEFAKYHKLRTDLNNGVTLCFSCHKKIHNGKKG